MTLADEVAEALREVENLAGNLATHDCDRWQCDEDYKPLIAAIRRYGDLREKAGFRAGYEDACDR